MQGLKYNMLIEVEERNSCSCAVIIGGEKTEAVDIARDEYSCFANERSNRKRIEIMLIQHTRRIMKR